MSLKVWTTDELIDLRERIWDSLNAIERELNKIDWLLGGEEEDA